MKKLLSVSLLAGLLSLNALAQEAPVDDYYGELGFAKLKMDSRLYSEDARPNMLRAVVGKGFTPWINGELMLGIGVQGDDTGLRQDLRAGAVTQARSQDVKTLLGLYVTPTAKFNDKFKVYGRLGWANLTVSDVQIPQTGTIRKDRALMKHDSLSYGVGAAFDLNESFSVAADYMVYYKRKDEKVDGFTLGVGYRF